MARYDWAAQFRSPAGQHVLACLLALQHLGRHAGDPAVEDEAWDASQYIQDVRPQLHELVCNPACCRALASALDVYPEHREEHVNWLIDEVKAHVSTALGGREFNYSNVHSSTESD